MSSSAAPDDNTFTLHDSEATPLLVSVPHAGLRVPQKDADAVALDADALRVDADLHCDTLTSFVPARGVSRLVQHVSRYVLDVNRAPDDVDDVLCPTWPNAHASPRGLCWRLTTDNKNVARRALSRTEVESRRERIHAPYHEALTRTLAACRARHGFAVLLDVHSMPSVGKAAHGDESQPRADVVPGDAVGTSCDASLMRLVTDVAVGAGFSVRPNDPYRGGYITRHHGRPAMQVHAIQLELNRARYMDERSFALSHRASDVTAFLQTLVDALSAWRPPGA